MRARRLGGLVLRTGLVLAAVLATAPVGARADDKLLAEAVDFTGTFIFLEARVPGLVIGVVRNGETVVRGYGEISDGSCFAARCWRAWWLEAASSSPTR